MYIQLAILFYLFAFCVADINDTLYLRGDSIRMKPDNYYKMSVNGSIENCQFKEAFSYWKALALESNTKRSIFEEPIPTLILDACDKFACQSVYHELLKDGTYLYTVKTKPHSNTTFIYNAKDDSFRIQRKFFLKIFDVRYSFNSLLLDFLYSILPAKLPHERCTDYFVDYIMYEPELQWFVTISSNPSRKDGRCEKYLSSSSIKCAMKTIVEKKMKIYGSTTIYRLTEFENFIDNGETFSLNLRFNKISNYPLSFPWSIPCGNCPSQGLENWSDTSKCW